MSKSNRHGKAEILRDDVYKRLKDCLPTARDRLIVAIAYWTGERMGAIVQLTSDSVYADGARSAPSDRITFRARTRKGKKDTRQVFIHPVLAELLRAYQPPSEGWLFPSRYKKGEHITWSCIDKMLRRALLQAGLKDLGISTHSFRHTLITRLHKGGASLKTIQAITGHRNLAVLADYIETDNDFLRETIFHLPAA